MTVADQDIEVPSAGELARFLLFEGVRVFVNFTPECRRREIFAAANDTDPTLTLSVRLSRSMWRRAPTAGDGSTRVAIAITGVATSASPPGRRRRSRKPLISIREKIAS